MNTQFETSENGKEEWLTPPSIISGLGQFDLDPCAPIKRPWDTAKKHYTTQTDGLKQPWFGRVWCNPPYGNKTTLWLEKLAEHGNGIALIFARTETNNFFDNIWYRATGLFFIKGRVHFHHVDGTRAEKAPGSPSVLVAYGVENAIALICSDLEGVFVELPNNNQID